MKVLMKRPSLLHIVLLLPVMLLSCGNRSVMRELEAVESILDEAPFRSAVFQAILHG